ncbi:hypothetical protein GCM10010499_35070 [Streptomyces thermoviolaceus subsp. apingens]|nr:hypothetical protein GCM10010499_35070 [Streptomyces thermoviolaceus subsp. apingens]
MRLARTAAAAAAAVAALFLPAVAQPAAAAPVTARTASVAVPGETLTLPVRDALARLSIAQRTGRATAVMRSGTGSMPTTTAATPAPKSSKKKPWWRRFRARGAR